MPAVATERAVYRGRVKWFNLAKGFGFIRPVGGATDIFVHYEGLVDAPSERHPKTGSDCLTLYTDQLVEYEIEGSEKGPRAVNVKVIQR